MWVIVHYVSVNSNAMQSVATLVIFQWMLFPGVDFHGETGGIPPDSFSAKIWDPQTDLGVHSFSTKYYVLFGL